MRGVLMSSVMTLMLTSSAYAAEDTPVMALTPAISAMALAEGAQQVVRSETLFRVERPRTARPLLLPSLYVASAGLQAYDAYSTLNALKLGGVEQNPFMKGITKNPAAFIAVKAAVTTASIVAAEKLWRDNNRWGAIGLMIASNSLMAIVAAHNASVVSRLR